ncbi:MAG: hypothetical protein ABJJ37_27155 [Roseibium sp.]
MDDNRTIRIAVVDDRGSVVDEFEELFRIELPNATVEKFETADDALLAINEGEEWSHWIVDLMMPIGEQLSKKETDDGLSTGIAIIKRLINSGVSISGRIFAFTLRDVNLDDLGGDNRVIVLPKSEYTIMNVVLRVKEIDEEVA